MDRAADMKEKWRLQAAENRKKAHDMIHDIGANYSRRPEQIAEMLEFGSKFYQYSLNNMKLIYSQNCHAVYVQSFEAWKEMGANVQKGQKGIKIFVPVQSTLLKLGEGKEIPLSAATQHQKALYKSGQIQGRKTIHFKVGNVFDISQTDFPTERYPEMFSMGYPSRKHADVAEGLREFCQSIGVEVACQPLNSISLRGFFSHGDNRIVINELLNDTQKLCTLSHEIGHAVHEHAARDISDIQKEFEADSISIMIQSHFGIELTETRKAHLAACYRKFKEEIWSDNPEITDDGIVKKVDAALSASMEVFRRNIGNIQNCVEKHCLSEAVRKPLPGICKEPQETGQEMENGFRRRVRRR